MKDAREAEHYAALHRRDVGPIQLEPGDLVELPPCISPSKLARLQRQGRECPRVELPAEAEPAARLIQVALAEHTRGFVPALIESIPEAEQGAAVRRATRALLADDVLDRLYPKVGQADGAPLQPAPPADAPGPAGRVAEAAVCDSCDDDSGDSSQLPPAARG